jgi:hypothetical protein
VGVFSVRSAHPTGLMVALGALIGRRGHALTTVVEKRMGEDGRQHWRRWVTFPDGAVSRFNSSVLLTPDGHLIEFVNPILGLEMKPYVIGQALRYDGVRYVAKLGRRLWTIPQWLTPGNATIVERAADDAHFDMDFRLTHRWFGEVFSYAGRFKVQTE